MSAAAGWYPDPGGQLGMYRYWDGRSWSASVSPHPGPPPPSAPLSSPTPAEPQVDPPRPRSGRGYVWLVALVAVLSVLVVVVVLVVRRVDPAETSATPGGQATSQVCPTPDSGTADPQPNDGRVHGGKLSYPRLGDPWSWPFPEYRVAFGRGVLIQSVEIERSAAGEAWEAAVLVGDLVAGDGFFAPRDGADVVVRCVTGTFYGNSEVTRDDQVNQAMTVDGHDAWIIESQLGFDVPGIKAKHELLIVVIVDTGDDPGLFYASIPENAPELVKPARDSLAKLRVDG